MAMGTQLVIVLEVQYLKNQFQRAEADAYTFRIHVLRINFTAVAVSHNYKLKSIN